MKDMDIFEKTGKFLISLPQSTKKLYGLLSMRRYSLTIFAYLSSAFFTGLFCVIFMRGFSFMDAHRLSYKDFGAYAFIAAPLLFIAAANIVRIFAPYAAGSGIPQILFAVKYPENPDSKDMASVTTLIVKIVSIFLGVWAGASVGREGPTVQVGACLFWLSIRTFAFFLPINADRSTALTAGGAAGLAAAFNTPLAGVTFAIEELAGRHFESIKDYALMAIIVSAISAQILTGDYVYFGKLEFLQPPEMANTVMLSIICGIMGAFFSKVILLGTAYVSKLSIRKRYILVPAAGAILVAALACFAGEDVQGPGNIAAAGFLKGEIQYSPLIFSISKFAATVITYLSGIAGGLFAPSLSIGSGTASGIAIFFGFEANTAAMLGMAAFLSAAIQAPITSFVIVFEMTGHSQMLLPIMMASIISYITAKALKARPLYSALSERYLP